MYPAFTGYLVNVLLVIRPSAQLHPFLNNQCLNLIANLLPNNDLVELTFLFLAGVEDSKYPRLELNDEERKMASKEGVTLSKFYPLTR